MEKIFIVFFKSQSVVLSSLINLKHFARKAIVNGLIGKKMRKQKGVLDLSGKSYQI